MLMVKNVIELYHTLKERNHTLIARDGTKKFGWSLDVEDESVVIGVEWTKENLVLSAFNAGVADKNQAWLAMETPVKVGKVSIVRNFAIYETKLPHIKRKSNVETLEKYALAFGEDVIKWHQDIEKQILEQKKEPAPPA